MNKEYSNGEITVLWDDTKCVHSANCVRGLPKVFNPARRPWINLEGTPSAAIVATVKTCPSGALTMKDDAVSAADAPGVTITLAANGPLLLDGEVEIVDEQGIRLMKKGPVAFCRCGASAKKPWCDGSHKRVGFLAG
jgi:uncharacterized Fe-S cluster protein YjdI